MQSKLANAIRSRFALQMSQELPQFKRTSQYETPLGWVVYACSVGSDLTLFVILAISPKEDRFTLEVAWSSDENLPQCSTTIPEDTRQVPGLCLRLSRLWQQYGFDHWWGLGREITLEDMVNSVPEDSIETKLAQVQSQVDDAIQKLLEFGIPYFGRVAAEHGHPIKLR